MFNKYVYVVTGNGVPNYKISKYVLVTKDHYNCVVKDELDCIYTYKSYLCYEKQLDALNKILELVQQDLMNELKK